MRPSPRQHSQDWNKRYLDEDTPWEDPAPTPEMQQAILHFAPPPCTVLEIGCGRGGEAEWLVKHGYRYRGIDLSEEAIRQAKMLAKNKRFKATFEQEDIFSYEPDDYFDLIIDKGCFHTFLKPRDRERFAARVSELLAPDGFWICLTGNLDHPDKAGDVEQLGHPRLSAYQIIEAAEASMEIHYLARCWYGVTEGKTDFLGWCVVMQRRDKRSGKDIKSPARTRKST